MRIEVRTAPNAAMGGRREQVVVAHPDADLDGARALVERALQPAPRKQIGQWLAALRLITAHPQSSAEEASAALRICVDRLAQMPGEAVHDALLRKRWRFFPTLAEVEDAADALAAPRRLLELQLRGAVRQASQRPAVAPETQAQRRAAAARIMAEIFGSERASEADP